MKKTAALLLLASLVACGKKPEKAPETDAAARFGGLKDRFVESMWANNPIWATQVGFHKYDSLMEIPDAATREKKLAWNKAWLDSLKTFDPATLPPNDRTDYYMMENSLNAGVWYSTAFKGYTWNPAEVNVGDWVGFMLTEQYAPLDSRLRHLLARLEQAPAYYAAGQANLEQPSKPHTLLAIQQNEGTLAFLRGDLADSLGKSGLSLDEKTKATVTLDSAAAAVSRYVTWLKAKEADPAAQWHDFRIGKELYEKKFAYDIESGLTAEQIYQKAVARKKEIHAEMYKLLPKIAPDLFQPSTRQPLDSLAKIRTVIDRISVKHVKSEDFVASVRQQIPELTAFVGAKNLLYLDPSKPLVVRETPEYMRGIAGASISAPGPYDKGGNTYYNVTPLDGLGADQAESWLREYNHYILQILNIHEAIPGHYAQLVYSNQSPSLIKSILGNGAMVEGWAVYTERMMLDAGYGNNEPEMWLMYYKWHLRSVCNTILDYSVHCLGMTEQQAMDLLMREAFQQEAEAKGKWRRVNLTSVQLTSYYTGFQEIWDLRQEWQKKQGGNLDLKAFHEKFLSYGSAPVKHIRTLMLE